MASIRKKSWKWQGRGRMAIKRICDECFEEVREKTLKKFPYYCSILKKGLFWYYLEHTQRKPTVHIENRCPCAPLYFPNRKTLLFDISYFHKRINLEVHHVLSDGSGALLFLKTLVFYYCLGRCCLMPMRMWA